MPVFGIVLIGYLVGGRLQLQAVTLTRIAYYIFIPAFIFQSMNSTRVSLDHAAKMICFIIIAHITIAVLTACIGRFLGYGREMTAALIMVAVSGNVGNYGIAVVHFRLGEAALAPVTLYYVVLSVFIFVVCVGVAGWARGGSHGIWGNLIKTPAIWAMILALLVSNSAVEVPVMLSRMIGLLGDAMIPVMLFSLGLQLLEQKTIQFNRDVFTASVLRLLVAPGVAVLAALPFGLSHIESTSGILQAGMPTAIISAIIAKEHNIVPHFVVSVIFFTIIASLVTLPLLMNWL